jgi:tryptophan synthase alpha chain
MRTSTCLEILAETRSRVDVPLLPMTYASIFEAYGWTELERDMRSAGATSMLVVDLPADLRPELKRVQLVAPTSTDARLKLAADVTDGWLYLVTVTGTTGARTELAPSLAPLAERARAVASTPLYAGFGISTREHARAAAELVDGIAVGTAAVIAAEDGAKALAALVTELRAGLDSVAAVA